MRHTDPTPVLIPILLTNPLITNFVQQSASIELVGVDTYESRDDVPEYFNHELLPFGVTVKSTWDEDTFKITGVLEPGNPNHGTSEGGETQYMFVSSDRFVMTVQQPGNVYIDSLTKIIMCCIYPKVNKLVYNDYFLEGSLAYPIKLLCYSFMINWGA